jgi:hypothetical protein
VRLGRPPKQCVWLGASGYCRRCRDAITNTDAESYAVTNSYTCCMRADVANTDAYGYSDSYSHAYAHTNSYSHANSDSHGHSDRYTHGNNDANRKPNADTYSETHANSETSAYAAA